VLEVALGRNDPVALPLAGPAVLTLAQALDTLAPVLLAGPFLELQGSVGGGVDLAGFHGDGNFVGGRGVGSGVGEAEGGREKGESEGETHFDGSLEDELKVWVWCFVCLVGLSGVV
jgi:hypothetical protein